MSAAVRIAIGDVVLDADLASAPDARGLVIFAHGSGSGRASPRNRMVAGVLQAPHALEIVPGATHLFPEPGALEQVEELARDWFVAHCPA